MSTSDATVCVYVGGGIGHARRRQVRGILNLMSDGALQARSSPRSSFGSDKKLKKAGPMDTALFVNSAACTVKSSQVKSAAHAAVAATLFG